MPNNKGSRRDLIHTLRTALSAMLLLGIAVWALFPSAGRHCGGFLASTAHAFGVAAGPCDTTTLPINTGYNNATGTTHAFGEADSNWQIIAPDPGGGAVPRPAGVIQKHSAWQSPLPNSQWITSYPTANNNLNADYWLEFNFCLQQGFANAKLDLQLRADDEAYLYLNGKSTSNSIGSSLGSFGLSVPTSISYSGALFIAGKNSLFVKLRNTGAVAMGLNIAGTVSANGLGGAGLLTAECCNPTGRILGAKWNDLNGNGVWDLGEPGLPGWQINLSNGQTAFTDNAGYYAFTNLTPGNYIVSETQKSCWQQTFPTGNGTHTINVAPNHAYIANFGNHNAPKANFAATTVCLGQPTQFTDLSGCATSWNWSFGSSAPNPAFTFTTAGTQTVTLCINSGASCVTKNVTVVAPPAAPFILGPSTACDKIATYTVANPGVSVGYLWTITGGTPATATGKTVTISWNAVGPYKIKVRAVNESGCFSETEIIIQPCNPPEGCCNFRTEAKLNDGYLADKGNGVYTFTPTLTATASNIVEVTATIISASQTTSSSIIPAPSCGAGGPLNSYVTGVSSTPPIGFNVGTLPVSYSREVEWHSSSSGGSPINAAPFSFDIQFPLGPVYPCNDSLRFCVKYTFKAIINGVCTTCERIECYTINRKGSFIQTDQTLKNSASFDATTPSATGNTVKTAVEHMVLSADRSGLAVRDGHTPPEREPQGPIWDKWRSLGGARSFLGQPVTGKLPIPNFSGEGDLARFQGGSIYFTPETGAVAIPDLAGSLIAARDYSQLKQQADDWLADPFVQLKAGRLAYVVAVGNGEYGLGDRTTQREALILFNPQRGLSEYFIVENHFRPEPANNGANGVMVWHVVEDLGLFDRMKPSADVLSEFGEHGLRLLRRADGQAAALTQPGDVMTSESLPALRWLDGSPAGFELRLLSVPGGTVRVAVTTLR